MESEFVTLTTCEFEAQAENVRMLLKQEGINAYVADANIVTANWFLGPAVGYIKVQVPRSEAKRAAEILRQHPRLTAKIAEEKDESPATCLACGSPMPDDTDTCPSCGWSFSTGTAQDEPATIVGPAPFEHTVAYEPDIQAALDKLRARLLQSRQSSGTETDPPTPDAALNKTGTNSTHSILDITRVTDEPDGGCAAPFSAGELQGYFGTDKPTKQMVQESPEFWENIQRGQARYIILYEGSKPNEIYFAGYSFD